MYAVKNGSVCIMLWSLFKRKWVFIPEKKWYKMTIDQKAQYSAVRV